MYKYGEGRYGTDVSEILDNERLEHLRTAKEIAYRLGENGNKHAYARHDDEWNGKGLCGVDVGRLVVSSRKVNGRHYANASGKHERHTQPDEEYGGGNVHCCQSITAYTPPNEDAVGKRKHGVEHQTEKGWHEKLYEQPWDVHLTKVDVVSVIHVGAVCRGGFYGLS